MSNMNKKTGEGGMSPFELGNCLARLDTKLDGLTLQVANLIRDFREIHRDHEDRIRHLETNSATKADNKKAHDRIDKLQSTIWKIIVYLAAGGTVTGGGIALFKYLTGGM